MNRTLPLLFLFLLLVVARSGICQNFLPEYLYSDPDVDFSDLKLNGSKEMCLKASKASIAADVLIRFDKTGKKLWGRDFPDYSIVYYDIDDAGNVDVITREDEVITIYQILANGNLAGVPATFTGSWYYPSKIIMDKTRNVYALWEGADDYLYVSKYNQNGIFQWDAFMGYAGSYPDMAINQNGQVLVANSRPDLFVPLQYHLEILRLEPNQILSGDRILETNSYTWETAALEHISVHVDESGNVVIMNARDLINYGTVPTTSFFILDPATLDVVSQHTIPFAPTNGRPFKVNVTGKNKFLVGQVDGGSYPKLALARISESHDYSLVTDSLNFPYPPWILSLAVDPGGNLSAVGMFPQQTSTRIYLDNYTSQGIPTGNFRYFGNQTNVYGSAPAVFDFENKLLVTVKGDLLKFTPCSEVLFSITSDLVNVEQCAGTDVKLEVKVSGRELSFYWYKNKTQLTESAKYVGTNTGSLVIKKADVLDAGTYYCEIKDACGRIIETDEAIVSIIATPSFTSAKPADISRCVGAEAIFEIAATGGKNLEYQWKKVTPTGTTILTQTTNVIGPRTNKLTLKAVSASDAGEYYCEVTSACGSAVLVSQKAILGIQLQTNITRHPETLASCTGGSVVLSVNASGTNLNFQWKKAGVDVVESSRYFGTKTSTLTLSQLQIADEGDYTCVVTGSCGTTQQSLKGVLTVTAEQQITSHPQSKSICSGANVTFSIATSTGGVTYQWVKGNTNLVNNARISGATTSSIAIQSATAADAGAYACIITTVCGNKRTSQVAQLQIGTTPSISAKSTDQDLCTGEIAKFSVTTNVTAGSFQWKKDGVVLTDGPATAGAQTPELFVDNINSSNAGNYTCDVSSGCGAPLTSGIIKLRVKEKVAIATQPAGAMLCDGDEAVLKISATGLSPLYQWKKDGSNVSNNNRISGANSPQLTIHDISAFEEGHYTCEVTGCDGVSASRTVFVQVNPKPKLILQTIDCDSPVADWSTLVDDERNTFGEFLLFKEGSTKPVPNLTSIAETGVYFIVKQTETCADTVRWNNECLITDTETSNGYDVSVYPNPTSRWIYIRYDPAQLIEFELLDSNGRKISSGVLEPSGETVVDGNLLSGGVYSVRLKGDKGKTIFERLIVKR